MRENNSYHMKNIEKIIKFWEKVKLEIEKL